MKDIKKIAARFGILANDGMVEISFQDDLAINSEIYIKIPYRDFLDAIGGRIVGRKCEVEFINLQYIGKIRESQTIEFKISDTSIYGDNRKELAKEKAAEICPAGWEPVLYFGSQDSFFYKDKELWGRTNILRWIDKA